MPNEVQNKLIYWLLTDEEILSHASNDDEIKSVTEMANLHKGMISRVTPEILWES